MLDKKDLERIRGIVKNEVKSELKPVKTDLTKISRSLGEVIEFFDLEVLQLRARVERIEEHLHILPIKDKF